MNTNTAVNFEQLSLIKDVSEPRQLRRMGADRAMILREMVISDGSFDNMEDTDALAVILGLTRGSAEPRQLAERLLNAFGSLKAVLEARPEQLANVDGMNAARVQMVAIMKPVNRLWSRLFMDCPTRIGNSREAESYCMSLLAGERNERFFVVALNAQCQVLGRRCISTGSLCEVSAYPRLVIETALNYNAHSVLLSHNHPGGTCSPSPEDVSSTIQLQRTLGDIGILVLDHIIVANDRTYSMIQHGDIDYRTRRH